MSREHAPPEEAEPAGEPGAQPPPTHYERLLVTSAGDVVSSCARHVAGKFPRHVGPQALMSFEDLLGIGHEASYRAARMYDEKRDTEFPAFARCYVRSAMLMTLEDLLFEERVKLAAAMTEANYCGYHRDNEYDVMKHDEVEAQRRYRAFANGLLAATFAAGLEEAQAHLGEAEADERRAYEAALVALRSALARLARAERQLVEVMYAEMTDLKTAAEKLGVPYGTARARHRRALAILHELLVEQGVTYAPRPLVAPDIGDVLGERGPPQNDTGTRPG